MAFSVWWPGLPNAKLKAKTTTVTGYGVINNDASTSQRLNPFHIPHQANAQIEAFTAAYKMKSWCQYGFLSSAVYRCPPFTDPHVHSICREPKSTQSIQRLHHIAHHNESTGKPITYQNLRIHPATLPKPRLYIASSKLNMTGYWTFRRCQVR